MPTEPHPPNTPVSDIYHYPHVAPQKKTRLLTETYD
jgi:hypothetical protein